MKKTLSQEATATQGTRNRWALVHRLQRTGPLDERFLPSASLQPNRNAQKPKTQTTMSKQDC